MLEILFLVYYGRYLAKTAREKGRNGTGWATFGVLAWVGAELAVGLVYGATTSDSEPGFGLYLGAVALAGLSALVTSAVLKALLSVAPSVAAAPVPVGESVVDTAAPEAVRS